MRAVVIAICWFGCASPDPTLGAAHWVTSPPTGPSALFELAYSEWHSNEVIVETVSYDGTLHCREARMVGGGGLSLRISAAGVRAPGEVPITADPLDPAVPAAHVVLGTRVYTGGTLTITSVDGTVEAKVEATDLGSTLSATFDATRCD